MAVLEDLTEDEAYLWAILSDPSGLDQAEFTWYDPENADGCFRAWPFQWKWWRCEDPKQIDQCSRAVGKSKSIQVRACAFPLLHPRQEMVVTAPEGVHLDAVTDNIETQITSTRLLKSLLQRERGKSAVKHKPFHVNFANGSRIMGRIPQRDGKGMKGCVVAGTHILAESGYVVVEDLKPGDLILVDSGEWLPISRIDVDVNESYKVVGQSSFPLTVSCDHRFLGSSNLAGPKQTRQLEKLYYHDVEDILDDNVYWASPTRFAPLPIPHLNYGPTSNKLEINESFWWLVGRYLADGHLSSNKGTEKRVCFSVHPKSLGEFMYHSNRVGVHVGRKRRSHSSADELTISSAAFFNWLESYFGRLSHAKIVPGFVFGMDAGDRLSFLDGYLKGDGTYEPHKNKWISGSASKALTMSIQLIAQSVGLKTTTWMTTPKVKEICGVKLVSEPRDAWYVSISLTGHQLLVEDHALVSKVKSVDFVGKQKVYNPIVNGNHSYVSNTIISHNTHPIWLELDEGQDYPEPGWKETIETLKRGSEGAVWRAHGVTRGVRDVFYRLTQPNSGWTTHRFTAMHRPNWTDQEREEKIMDYGGSRDHPDYKRNILGLHGDATNPLFVLHRLMACVDQVKSSEYNTDVYYERKISDEELSDGGGHIANLINLPGSHKGLSKTFWVGMDVGFCADPDTEIFTDRGWLKYSDLRLSDKTLGIDKKTGCSVWQDVTNIYQEEFTSIPMVKMKGQSFDALVTPHHKWLVAREDGSLRWKETRELNTKDLIPLAVPRGDIPVERVYSDDFVELVAWYWTEGWKISNSSIGIAQSRSANPVKVERIERLFYRLFGEPGNAYMQGTRKVEHQWCSYEKAAGGVDFHGRGPVIDDLFKVVDCQKIPATEFLASLTGHQLELFIETSIDADGWRTSSGAMKIEQRLEAGIRMFEVACALSGRATSTSYDPIRGRYHLSILKSSTMGPVRAAMFPRKSAQAMSIEIVDYSGVIWCPTTTHGNWLARRNGSVYYTGNTNHPSEVLVFGEISERKLKAANIIGIPDDGPSALPKGDQALILLTRLKLDRISHPHQVDLIDYICNYYNVQAFSMDKTGNGLPLFQDAQHRSKKLANVIKGYNFSEKILVDFDLTVDVDEFKGDLIEDSGIKKNVLEYSSDVLRDMVDNKRIVLPFDRELIAEFEGQTYFVVRDTMNQYGKREFSKGQLHALDAAKMAVLGMKQNSIEEFTKQEKFEPVMDIFFG